MGDFNSAFFFDNNLLIIRQDNTIYRYFNKSILFKTTRNLQNKCL